MGGGVPWLGYPGSLQQLPKPAVGYEPADIIRAANHELLNGGNTVDRLGVRRQFTLSYPATSTANYLLLRALTRIPGPYRYLDPVELNQLTVNQSIGGDELRTTDGVVARFQGVVTVDTAQFRSWTRSFKWDSQSALSATGRGPYLYNSSTTVDGTWAAIRPGVQYTLSGYARASAAVNFQALIDWHSPTGTYLSTVTGSSTAVGTTDFTTRLTVTATAPANAGYGIGAFINTSTPGATRQVWFDELQLEEGAAASSFRLGVGTPWVTVESLGHSVVLSNVITGRELHQVEMVLVEVG
jgi:hypothetical protein